MPYLFLIFIPLFLDEDTDINLTFRVRFGLDTADADFEYVVHAHIKHTVDLVVTASGNVTEEIVAKENGDSFGVIFIITVENQVQLGADLF